MIRSLRKRHLNVWIILALLLPVGFVWAYKEIPANMSQLIEKSSVEEMFLVKRVVGANGKGRLEITIKRPLTTPSTLIYLASEANPDIKTATLIGSLGPQGTYHINLPSSLPQQPVVLFYDAINKNLYHQTDVP